MLLSSSTVYLIWFIFVQVDSVESSTSREEIEVGTKKRAKTSNLYMVFNQQYALEYQRERNNVWYCTTSRYQLLIVTYGLELRGRLRCIWFFPSFSITIFFPFEFKVHPPCDDNKYQSPPLASSLPPYVNVNKQHRC